MAYSQGGLIEAVDFNTLRSALQNVYGVGFGNSGYGQTAISVPTVSGGLIETIKSAEWTALRNAAEVCALHQGTATTLLPPTTDINVGDVIVAHDGVTDPDSFPGMLSLIQTNRLTAAPTSNSLAILGSDAITTTWTNLATTTVDFTFPTADDARYFFNSGGQILLSGNFSGTSTPQNDSWTDLLVNTDAIIFDYASTTGTGTGTGSSLGYYDLPSSGTAPIIFESSPPSGSGTYYFGVNRFRVRAITTGVDGTNGDNGRTIRFTIQFIDNFSGGSDQVSGRLEVVFAMRIANTHLTVNPFTINVVTPLNAV